MRGDLISIGDMARLKGIGVKALRHYERIGILPPAYVNPVTGYRYYTMRQSSEIDLIISCLDLGIPLKEIENYRAPDGTLDMGALLERGHARAIERLRRARATLMQVESYQEGMEVREGEARNMAGRTLLLHPWGGPRFDTRRYVKAATSVFEHARESGLVPLFFQGLLRLPAGPTDESGEPVESGAAGTTGAPGAPETAAGVPGAPETATTEGATGGGTWFTAIEVGRIEVPDGLRRPTEPQGETGPQGLGGGLLLRLPDVAYRARRIEGPDFESCFALAFEAARRLGPTTYPLLAFEVWGNEFHTDRVVLELMSER